MKLLVIFCFLQVIYFIQCQKTQIEYYERVANIASPNLRYQEVVAIQNSNQNLRQIQICEKTSLHQKYATIKVVIDNQQGEEGTQLKVGNSYQLGQQVLDQNITCFDVKNIKDDGEARIANFPVGQFIVRLDIIATKAYKLLPEEILQKESQYIEYSGFHVRPFMYPIKKAVSKVYTDKLQKLSYSRQGLQKTKKSRLEYQFEDIQAYQTFESRVHLEMNRPLTEIISLTNEITISHYGNIYIDQFFDVTNWGAKQKPYWSRQQFQADVYDKQPQHYIQALILDAPHNARWLYFKDQIGNVSTSVVNRLPTKTNIALKPRHPIFGGWRSIFQFGYSVPIQNFVQKSQEGTYKFKIGISTGLTDDHFVDDFKLKVVLPPGVSIKSMSKPENSHLSEELRYLYLDYFGRRTIVISKENFVPYIQEEFEILYDYPLLAFLYKPAVLVTGVFGLLALFILLGRMDFSISRDKEWSNSVEKQKLENPISSILYNLKELKTFFFFDDVDALEKKLAKDLSGDIIKMDKQALLQDWKIINNQIISQSQLVLSSTNNTQFKVIAENIIDITKGLLTEGNVYINHLQQDLGEGELRVVQDQKNKMKAYITKIQSLVKELENN